MSVRTTGKSFYQQHWDWLVALGGLAAAGAAFAYSFVLSDPVVPADLTASAGTKVADVDMTNYEQGFARFAKPTAIAAPAVDAWSFLQPGERKFCKSLDASDADHPGCGHPLPAGLEKCFLCDAKLLKNETEVEAEKENDDTDGDGLPDVFEKRFGLDANKADADEDKDGDGFTNAEEFKAQTDPSDPKSHLDYLDEGRVSVTAWESKPLRLTFTKFKYQANGKQYLEFYNPEYKEKNYYCQGILSIAVGEEIKVKDQKAGELTTGFLLKEYKEETKDIVYAGGTKSKVDASYAIIERISDGKRIKLLKPEGKKKVRETPMDTLVTVAVEIPGKAPFVVGEGQKIDLSDFGVTYEIVRLNDSAADGTKRGLVTIRNVATQKEKILECPR